MILAKRNSCSLRAVRQVDEATVRDVQCRFIIYKKGLEGDFDIKSPKELGGLTSESYKALNPLAKMPLLVLPGGTALPESEVRARRPAHRRAVRRAARPYSDEAAAAERLCLRPLRQQRARLSGSAAPALRRDGPPRRRP